MDVNIKTIKLVIWDLDDTLWQGTLSEGEICFPEKCRLLLQELTDAGIVNSICSKNDADSAICKLKDLGIWEYFVFASINWENKGLRLKQQIEQMALRPINVLFIDDNQFNLREAKFVLPDLQVAEPSVIDELTKQVKTLPHDSVHKRLQQYKILEEKAEAAKSFDSNEEFLFASNIRVAIRKDCEAHIERIHELILRSNQLNFTKRRISFEELSQLLNDKTADCGYIAVSDNYGDYGIVGFYAVRDKRLEHFVFSCRTMGQMIEQYVYAQLGFPEIEVVGEVRTQLNKTDQPKWINQSNAVACKHNAKSLSCKILIKGPCDLSHAQSYIHSNKQIATEFTYVRQDGLVVDTYNHSVHIAGLHEYTDDDNRQIVQDCPFVDPAMLRGTFFSGNYDVIFLSSLIESVYPIYRKRGTNIRVVYNGLLSESQKVNFEKAYEYEGLISPEQYEHFLQDCLHWLPHKTVLCIILGATLPLQGSEQMAERHRQMNDVVKHLAARDVRVRYIDVDDFIHTANDVTDTLNHYQTRVYYEIGQAMIHIVGDVTGHNLHTFGAYSIWLDVIINKIRGGLTKIISQRSCMYRVLKRIYLVLSRRQDNVR